MLRIITALGINKLTCSFTNDSLMFFNKSLKLYLISFINSNRTSTKCGLNVFKIQAVLAPILMVLGKALILYERIGVRQCAKIMARFIVGGTPTEKGLANHS